MPGVCSGSYTDLTGERLACAFHIGLRRVVLPWFRLLRFVVGRRLAPVGILLLAAARVFGLSDSVVVFNEIHYNPAGDRAGGESAPGVQDGVEV